MSELYFIAKGMPNKIKSAGDIRALRMLKILKSKYNIQVIARSADFGEGDVRGIGCTPHLTGCAQNIIKMHSKIKKPDVVILSHWTIANENIDYVRQTTDAKIYVDTIDVEFLRLQRKRDYAPDSISQEEVDKVKSLELAVYNKADGLIVVSEQDKTELLKYGSFNFVMLPCLFSINENYVPNDGKNSYIICNWSHEPNIATTSYLCQEVVPNVDTLFYIVGKHPPAQIRAFASSKINVAGAEYEINKFLSKMNILLSPIFYGAGMNGKIGESLGFGIPVITNALGALPFGLKHRETAMIAETAEEHIENMKEIINCADLRSSLSVNGRELMKQYTIEFWQEKLLSQI